MGGAITGSSVICAADAASIAAIRRRIHVYPELCFEEQRTSELIAKTLSDWDIPVYRGIGKTGVVGIIRGGPSNRAIGLRADMDALPLTEQNGFDHKSLERGKMHACGHDGHIAMLLAAAKYLANHRDFDGSIYLIFQPAEESGGGAREMIKEGLFKRFPMDAIFGVHNWPGLPVGQFAVSSGPVFASNNEFRIRIRGKGAHAALPQEGIDPVIVGCQMVLGFQAIITRNKRPADAGVLSVTIIHAGEAINAVPDSCEIRGTVRSFTFDVLDLIESRMREIADGICAAFKATCDFEFHRNYPQTINHTKETAFVRNVLSTMAGDQNVLEFQPTMGAEDFGFYLLEKAGCYFLIGNGDGDHRTTGHGAGPCMLHNPSYDFNDELISIGGTMWVRLVQGWFSQTL